MRLFFGLRPSLPTRRQIADRLSEVQQNVQQVAWVPLENLHLTLAFLGEVNVEMLPELNSVATRGAQGSG